MTMNSNNNDKDKTTLNFLFVNRNSYHADYVIWVPISGFFLAKLFTKMQFSDFTM